MSPAMSALSSVGITHQILILAFLALIAAGVIGMFWQYILPGTIIIIAGTLFYVAPDGDVKPTKDNAFDEHAAYIEDCTTIAEYSKQKCERLWANREIEEDEEN